MHDERDLHAQEDREDHKDHKEREEVIDLREHTRSQRHKLAADRIVMILRELLTSWRIPKDQKPGH